MPAERHHDSRLEKLRQAAAKEHSASAILKARRIALDKLMAELREQDVPYDQIAKTIFRASHGRSPNVSERERETTRLRKRWQRVTACPADQKQVGGVGDKSSVRLPVKEDCKMINPRLISRRTVEETFATADGDDMAGRDLDGDEELDGDDEDEDASDERRAAARGARR